MVHLQLNISPTTMVGGGLFSKKPGIIWSTGILHYRDRDVLSVVVKLWEPSVQGGADYLNYCTAT